MSAEYSVKRKKMKININKYTSYTNYCAQHLDIPLHLVYINFEGVD